MTLIGEQSQLPKPKSWTLVPADPACPECKGSGETRERLLSWWWSSIGEPKPDVLVRNCLCTLPIDTTPAAGAIAY